MIQRVHIDLLGVDHVSNLWYTTLNWNPLQAGSYDWSQLG